MIGDLIPNIANDPKISGETNKGSGETAAGTFSSLLKTFEQEINVTGNLENQESGEQQVIESSIADDQKKSPFAAQLVEEVQDDQNTDSFGSTLIGNQADNTEEETDAAVEATSANSAQESETSEEKNIEAGELSIPVAPLFTNTQNLEQQGGLNPAHLDVSNSENSLTANKLENAVGEKPVGGEDAIKVLPVDEQVTVSATEVLIDEELINSNQTDANLTNEADQAPINVSSTETDVESELKSSNSKVDQSLDLKNKTELNQADEKANHPVEKAVVEGAQKVESAQTVSGAKTGIVAATNSSIDRQSEQASAFLNRRTFTQKNESISSLQQWNASQTTSSNKGEDVANPMSFNTVKSSEILQAIQQNKAVAKVSKEVKGHRFALSNSEQAETRLKLLVDSVRPELLANRELPADFNSTTTNVELSEMFTTTGALTSEQELMMKDLMVETTSGKEAKTSESINFGFMRLNELTVMNTSARRSIVSSFGKVLQESLKSDHINQSEKWQKHTFKLEAGNSIDLTTRNIDGVLHIKLAASNPELNRMLQSMEQEIKDHLKEELNLELDLQFNQSGDENDAESLQKGILSEKAKLASNQARELQKEESVKTNSGLNPSIRSFGYNQMEWTA
ncbi:MAG: hypothetical protein JJ895_08145 [Balneolaceae bacterium]|nr:hypothetical protein [Balneolaceae bacterium]